MEGAMVLAVFEGDEVRVEVRVHERGFSVSVVDPDAGEVVGCVMIFPGKDAAIAYAKRCAGVK
jgi:hypothetical protein